MGKKTYSIEEANKQRNDFIRQYAPDKLKKLSDSQILEKMFFNKQGEPNMSQAITSNETGAWVKVSGGSQHHWRLFWNSKKGKEGWTTGGSTSSKVISDEKEVIRIATKIRDEITTVTDYVEKNIKNVDYQKIGELFKENQYVKIYNRRYLKYFAIIYPEVFPMFYSVAWQKAVIKNEIKGECSEDMAMNLGTIAKYVKDKNVEPYEFALSMWNKKDEWFPNLYSDENKEKLDKFNFTEDQKKLVLGDLEKAVNDEKKDIDADDIDFDDHTWVVEYVENILNIRRPYYKNIDELKGLWETIIESFNQEKEQENINNCESSKPDEEKDYQPLNYAHNRIIFGAPGTGKSHTLEKQTNLLKDSGQLKEVTRVTFHPDYSYAHFVGCYKPYMEGKDIRYEFIAGPFLEVYKKAKKDTENHYVLIIEEINRANVAAVFGDVFQLLDRYDKDNEEKGEVKGESEYPIATSKDIKDWLTEKNKETKTENAFSEEEAKTLSIPKNMYIWATMNSADQGVYPMDTAFKRRWTFEYMDIDQGKDSVKDWKILLPNGTCEWNDLREAINEKLIAERVNEDKCLGPHFIKEEDGIDKGKFASKVLMYLFEDVVKQNPLKIFNLEKNEMIFSKVCKKFFEKGLEVFNLNKVVNSIKFDVNQGKGEKTPESETIKEVAATQVGEDNE